VKFTWELHDVLPGRRVGKHDRTEQWLIGYDPSLSDTYRKWALISLEDGMLSSAGVSKRELADRLNSSGDYPVELFAMMRRAANAAELDAERKGG